MFRLIGTCSTAAPQLARWFADGGPPAPTDVPEEAMSRRLSNGAAATSLRRKAGYGVRGNRDVALAEFESDPNISGLESAFSVCGRLSLMRRRPCVLDDDVGVCHGARVLEMSRAPMGNRLLAHPITQQRRVRRNGRRCALPYRS